MKSIAAHQHDFTISIFANYNKLHAKFCDDMAMPLFYALQRIGCSVAIKLDELSAYGTNIIFGLQDCHGINFDSIPANSIIYNFEQFVEGSKALRPHYLRLLSKFMVWEYSLRNYKIMSEQYKFKNICYVPLGYVPEMTRLDPDYEQDIDVLFYGSMNNRRNKIIADLKKRGINALAIDGCFGRERDFLIARSKVVLNMHFYTPGIQEIVRMSYLLANQKTIVAERNNDTEVHSGFEECCFYAPYEQLVDKIEEVLKAPKARKIQAELAFKVFSETSYMDILLPVLKEMKLYAPKDETGDRTLPSVLNVSSTKNYKPEAINININRTYNPDIVMDLSTPLDFSISHSTTRFGSITLLPGRFKKIQSSGILEQAGDVHQVMKNFLDLLDEGGLLTLKVPYDLSAKGVVGKRSFNENSWDCYAEQACSIGWREYRFQIKKLEYLLSDLGKRLNMQGVEYESIINTPRAVDDIYIELVKRKSTGAELFEYDMLHGGYYKNAVGEWSVC